MMKYVTRLVFGVLALVHVAYAFTPSASLVAKLDKATTVLENMIDQRGEDFREEVLEVLESFSAKYSTNERVQYIVETLSSNLAGEEVDENEMNGSDDIEGSNYSNDYLGSYTISDVEYGTQVTVRVDQSTRVLESNALPNHDTGDFPNAGNPNEISAQDKSYEMPVDGEYEGNEEWAREPGVAINGVKFEPETAERVECSTGEQYKIEALQDMTDLGLDHNHAHVQPTGEYHYHGVPAELIAQLDGDDIVHVGFAQDGFKIMYSKDGTYSPSYQLSDAIRTGSDCEYRGKSVEIQNTQPDGTYVSDWEYVAGMGDLDACNGTEIDGEYVYFVTEEYPYVGRCLQGDFEESAPSGSAPTHGGSERRGPPPPRG